MRIVSPVCIISLSSVAAEAVRKEGWVTKMKEFGRRLVTGRAWEGEESEKQEEMKEVDAKETIIIDQC